MENIGGHIALIVNNVEVLDIESVIMADDGQGKNIFIPGVLISKEDGEIIKTYYKNNKDKINRHPIILEIDFEMETSDNTVSLDVYFGSHDDKILKLLVDLQYYLFYLGNNTKFNPRFVTYTHPQYNFSEFNDVKSNNCIAGGRYCTNPKNDDKVTGKDIIIESIKMKCAYFLDVDKDASGYSSFIGYLEYFMTNCCNPNQEGYFTEACSALALQKAGYDISKVNECYADSFSPKGKFFFINKV